jgi:hypothetical protein
MSHPDPSRREDFERATLYAESRSNGIRVTSRILWVVHRCRAKDWRNERRQSWHTTAVRVSRKWAERYAAEQGYEIITF